MNVGTVFTIKRVVYQYHTTFNIFQLLYNARGSSYFHQCSHSPERYSPMCHLSQMQREPSAPTFFFKLIHMMCLRTYNMICLLYLSVFVLLIHMMCRMTFNDMFAVFVLIR